MASWRQIVAERSKADARGKRQWDQRDRGGDKGPGIMAGQDTAEAAASTVSTAPDKPV